MFLTRPWLAAGFAFPGGSTSAPGFVIYKILWYLCKWSADTRIWVKAKLLHSLLKIHLWLLSLNLHGNAECRSAHDPALQLGENGALLSESEPAPGAPAGPQESLQALSHRFCDSEDTELHARGTVRSSFSS